ncbi:hypothetical protein L207DRAFT_496293 [Hyaloscypha variabilis F]|uniref:Uncharacterized protein n=1 Tax=Hyaloscypha variabilis (strain UAMH 11265 / GT02V1 / F) TaxID=1149755 RepID=A0A2J6R7N1_HYAVF|nr:hypothetical protein L207DRAFT_496293 [Hyaloscypha variabilis F]
MRYIPFVAWFICLAALILCLVTFLAGIDGDVMENNAILTFNTSSLGMSKYNNSSTPALSENIGSLLPPGVTQPPSLTQYLGVRDWYSMHYLRTCSGFFTASSSNPSLLTPKKINITCTSQGAGYAFILNELLRNGLNPSVQALADDIPGSRYNTRPWYSMWQVGQVTGISAFITIPYTWAGTRRVNGYCVLWSFLSYIFFNINAGLVTHQIFSARSRLGTSIVPYPLGFLALTWSTCVAMFVVFVLMQIEWRFQLWTLNGDRITLYRKPKYCSWHSMNALGKPEQIHETQIRDKE